MFSKSVNFLALTLVLLLAAGIAYGWETMAPLPAARSEGGFVSDGTYGYYFGGYTGSGVSDACYKYDPGADSWTSLTAMTTAMAEFGISYYDEKVFLFGGYDGSGNTKTVQIYDIQDNSWSTGADLPLTNGSYGSGALTIDNTIWVLGGSDYPISNLADVKIYDVIGDSWTSGDTMETARWEGNYFEAGGYVYAVGGNDATYVPQAQASRWSGAKGTWVDADMADYPVALAAAAEARTWDSVGGNWRFYVLGGYGGSGPAKLDDVYYYDPDADTWTAGPTLDTATEGGRAVCLDGYIYLAGGWDSVGTIDVLTREDVGDCVEPAVDDDTSDDTVADDTAADDTGTDDDVTDDAADDAADDTAHTGGGDDDDDDDGGCCGC
jgi:hypothetical protein